MTKEQIQHLEFAWSFEGFLGQLRDGKFDPILYEEFITLLRSISFKGEDSILKEIVSLLWYIPLFMEWQCERVKDSISLKEYERKKTVIENELERILGTP